MTKILIIFLILLQSASSDSYWIKYGWQIFETAGDARSLALGNARVAGQSGSGAALWNPAYQSDSKDNHITYAHQNRFAGIVTSDLLNFSFHLTSSLPVEFYLLREGISNIPDTRDILLDWGSDGIPGTGDAGEGNGQLDDGERLNEDKLKFFSQRQWAVQLSTGTDFKAWKIGLAVKGLYHSLSEHYGSGFGINIGLIRPLWKNAQFGLAIQDVLTSWLVWDNGTIERAKPKLQTGFVQVLKFGIPVSVSVHSDIIINSAGKSIDDDFSVGSMGGNYRLGVELVFRDRVHVRFGRNDIAMIAAGLGLKWTQIRLDYAFQMDPLGSAFGNSHFVSFSIDPDWFLRVVGSYL